MFGGVGVMKTVDIRNEIQKLQKESSALLDGLQNCYNECGYGMPTKVVVTVHKAMMQAREMYEALIDIKVTCLAYEQGKSI